LKNIFWDNGFMLLPHYEQWINTHKKVKQQEDIGPLSEAELDWKAASRPGKPRYGRFEFRTGSKWAGAGVDSVAGAINGNTKFGIVNEIAASAPDSWWLFQLDGYGGEHWTFVNFEEKKIYIGPEYSEGYRWKDPWDVTTWEAIGAVNTLFQIGIERLDIQSSDKEEQTSKGGQPDDS
jgi:hypothetical protein